MASRSSAAGLIAGGFALASGVAYLAYLVPSAGRDGAITAWNLLIIPTALYLGVRLAARGPLLSAVSMTAGVGASLLWAFDYDSPRLEPWWIGLAGAWWLGLARLLWDERPRLARFTLILAVATALDFVLTALEAPMPIYALGGFKIPLTIAWTWWVGIVLVRDAPWRIGGAGNTGDAGRARWSGATALVGGLVWALLAVGWTLSHGSTQSPRGVTLLGFGALEFTRLLAVPALLWLLSLMSATIWSRPGDGRAARAGSAMALAGAGMVGLGAILQTAIVDPSRQFGHPAVQGGWLLFIAGLLPALSVGMLLLGLAPGRAIGRSVSRITRLIGLLSPLPVVAFLLSGVSDGGTSWDVLLATLHAAPGLGWLALGYRQLSGPVG